MYVKELTFEAFQIKLDCTVLEILLGIPCEKNTVMCAINFVILYAKRYIYIYNCKISNNNFLSSPRNRLKAEIYICEMSSECNVDSALCNFWKILFAKCS